MAKRHAAALKVSPADAWAARRCDGAIVLDVRTARERAAGGSIPGAIAGSWLAPSVPDHEGPVFVVCSHGARSLFAAHRLRAAGVDARSIRGGMAGHRRAGLPTDAGRGGG